MWEIKLILIKELFKEGDSMPLELMEQMINDQLQSGSGGWEPFATQNMRAGLVLFCRKKKVNIPPGCEIL